MRDILPSGRWGLRWCWEGAVTSSEHSLLSFATFPQIILQAEIWADEEKLQTSGSEVRSAGVQAIFSSVLWVAGESAVRNRMQCKPTSGFVAKSYFGGFGLYENGAFYHDCRLSGRDGIHLSRRCRGTFSNTLTNLVRQVLNWRTWGTGFTVETLTILQQTYE